MKGIATLSLQKSLICIAIGIALSTNASAEEEKQSASSEVEQLVVWGTQVSSNSELLVNDDLSLKQADHMSDLLRDVPGVDVGGTHSLNQRINIRGLGESDLDIRLDGASQNANMFHHIGNLTLNPDILKSVDIRVGNNSVTQGELGGAVYFETKNATDLLRYGEKAGVRVYGGYATNNSQQGSITAYGMFSEKVDAMFYAHYVNTDNFTDGSGTESFGTAGEIYNIMGKVGFTPSAAHRFEFTYDLYKDEGDYSPRPDMNGQANESFSSDALVPTAYQRDTLTLRYSLDTQQHQGNVTLYTSAIEIERDETVFGDAWPAARNSVNTATNRNSGLNAIFHSDFNAANYTNTLTYGIDYIHQSSSSTYGSEDFMSESTDSSAVFLENKLYVTDNWSITGGLRYDNFKRDAVTSEDTFNEVTWSLGTNWDINQHWAVFANTRSLFKGPQLLETFVRYQDVTYLDDDIEAETGLNSQVGFSYNNEIGAHQYGINVNLFKTDIDNYMTETWATDYSSLTIANSGDVEIKGFEVSTSYAYSDFSGKLSYSRSDMQYQDSGLPVDDGNGVSADMGDSIALTLDYYQDTIDTLFGWTSIAVLEEDNVFDGAEPKAGYNTHNLYAQWIPRQVDGLSVTFGIDNIFDEEYVSHASRSGTARGILTDDFEPGRNYKLSAAYQF